ncbi:MAG: hypothetical protein WC437_04940 [Patescibacteria group bacterium]
MARQKLVVVDTDAIQKNCNALLKKTPTRAVSFFAWKSILKATMNGINFGGKWELCKKALISLGFPMKTKHEQEATLAILEDFCKQLTSK